MKSILQVILVPIIMTSVCLYLLWPFEQLTDIIFYDETSILSRGVSSNFSYQKFEQSPMYAQFYQLLAYVFPEPVYLYKANHAILFITFIFLLSSAVICFAGSPVLAILCTVCFVYMEGYLIWPRVNFFSLIYILLILLFLRWLKGSGVKIAFGLISAYFLIFIRPEFYISFYLLYGFALALIVYHGWQYRVNKESIRQLLPLILAMVISSGLLIFFVTPLISDSNRSFVAFSQHYSLFVHSKEGLATDPWLTATSIMQRDFNGAKTLTEALLMSPGNFIEHVLNNMYKVLLFCFEIIGFLLVFFVIGKRSLRSARVNTNTIVITMLLLPQLLAAVLIYPRMHYLLAIFVLLMLLVSEVFPKQPVNNWKSLALAVIAAVLMVMVPPRLQLATKKTETAINKLRVIEKQKPLGNVLEVDGGWCVYLSSCQKQYSLQTGVSIDWVKNNIQTLFISNRFVQNSQGTELLKLIEQPELYGYATQVVSKDLYLLVAP